jgi:acyl-coenzyme A thioesterase PaaI-like protein
MEILKIPFVKKVGIQKTKEGKFELKFDEDIKNHLETIHASALFTLAETASGKFLQDLYPELVNTVIPVMRESRIKYKKPAIKDVVAYPSVSNDEHDRFKEQLENKSRALISVNIEIRDVDNTIICTAEFKWFIQKI